MTDEKPLKEVIVALANVFTRVDQRLLKEYMNQTGLSHSQMMTLARLYRHGGGGISAMGAHLGTTDAAASQLIDRLVNLGMVERIESETDRRAKKVILTAKGRASVEEMIARREDMVKRMLALIPPEKQRLIVDAAVVLAQAAQEFEQSLNLEEKGTDSPAGGANPGQD